MGKLAFDRVPAECITEHPDFEALTNGTVLQQVCPLLKDRKGKNYRFLAHGSQNAKNE